MNVICSTAFNTDEAFAPLVNLVGETNAAQYMYMCTYNTRNMVGNVRIQAYKHSTTRAYIYLDNSGNFYKRASSCSNSFYEAHKSDGICKIIDNAIADSKI